MKRRLVETSADWLWEHFLAWPGRLLRLPMRREIQYNLTLTSSDNRHLAEED